MKILGIVVLILVFSFFLIVIIGQDRDISRLVQENQDQDSYIKRLNGEILLLSKTQRILFLRQEILDRRNNPQEKIPFKSEITEHL